MEHHYKNNDVTVVNDEACIILNSFEFKKRIFAEEDILNIIYIEQEHPPPKNFKIPIPFRVKSRLLFTRFGYLKTFQV